MLALSTISRLKADDLFPHIDAIKKAMSKGSVITIDNGVKVLAGIAAHKKDYQKAIMPFLLEHLSKCRTKEVPQHAESTLIAIQGEFVTPFSAVLEKRLPEMSASQANRIKRILKQF